MVHYLLYASLTGELASWPWDVDLTRRGIVLLSTRKAEDAVHYCQASPFIMVMVDVPDIDEAAFNDVARISETMPASPRPPLAIVHQAELTEEQRARFADLGVNDLIRRDDPAHFILWRLDTLIRLTELHRFEQTRLDVADLAARTREQLHELSQPLSAIQGRLQLMAAQCPTTDPNATHYQDLVRLIFQVSQRVRDIQQIHRSCS